MFVGNAKPVQHLVDHNALRIRLLIFMMKLMVTVMAMVLVSAVPMMMVALPCLRSLDSLV